MAEINEGNYSAAYMAGKDWVEGRITERAAVDQLVGDQGMNRASASDYVRNLRQMLNGEPFHRTLNIPAVKFYLDSIRADFGDERYRNALKSLEAHLDYYASLPTGHEQPGLRKLLSERQARLAPTDIKALEAALAIAVQAAMASPVEDRQRRLASAPKKPSKMSGTVVVYKRNPDVIAEVLLRADGRCETCGQKAPFLKKSDGSPYLEVHHKVRLADDGEDTVENAVAVCPNCHRRAHYG